MASLGYAGNNNESLEYNAAMQVIEWSQFLEKDSPLGEKPSAVTVGIFDGVHRGHKALIEQVVSQKEHAVPVVITFKQSNHKKASYCGNMGDILSFRQKIDVFESLGVSLNIVIEFSESFKRMSGREFLHKLYEHGKMSFMAVGSNFRCGYQLDTDAPMIRQMNAERNISTFIIQPLTENGHLISSSLIRAAIVQGKLKAAATMLGRPFTVDLLGASVSYAVKADDGIAYDIAGRGGILPLPGKYPVLLLEKDCNRSNGKPAEVIVEGRSIIISRDLEGFCPEYVEF
jgi:riboflavin kinase/FMN adenylyltransferase